MVLHLVNNSHKALAQCLRYCTAGDAILLIENGVTACVAGPELLSQSDCQIYVLEDDLALRGLAATKPDWINSVSYTGFVELAAQYPKCQSWF